MLGKAKYIIRLDDASHYMDISKWHALEEIFNDLGISPIVAVVPENRDSSLIYTPKNPSFWECIKRWQNNGWVIAMHGLHHEYHHADREKSIIAFHDRSEFSGLSLSRQSAIIRKSLDLFLRNKIRPKIWIAPSHSFDENTIRALSEVAGIKIISDGIALGPYKEKGAIFLPQQLWWPKWYPALLGCGIWTICLHPNLMSSAQIVALRKRLGDLRGHVDFVDPNNIISIKHAKAKSRLSKIYELLFMIIFNFKNRK